MKKSNLWLAILAITLVFSMTAVGCDNGSTGGNNQQKAVYQGIAAGYKYILTITENQTRAAYTPAKGDGYELRITKAGMADKVSKGAVSDVSTDGTLTLQPAKANSPSFRVKKKGQNITGIPDPITLDDGETITAGGFEEGEKPGEPDAVFTSIAAMAEWLSAQPENTAATAYTVALNVDDLGGGSYTEGSVVNVLGNCSKYVNLDLSSSTITNIDGNLSDCYLLVSVNIPSSVTSLGTSVPFSNCSNLIAINVDTANTKYISVDGILYNKAQTTLLAYPAGKMGTSFTIPSNVTGIGYGAFSHASFVSVTIPNSVTSIEKFAFTYNQSLTSITIPSNVTSIGGGLTFINCTSLTAINIDADNTKYISVDGVLYNKDKTTLVVYPAGKEGVFTIPNSVTSIGDYAFSYCTGLTSITIPNSVTSIEDSAFANCTSLTSVTIPSSVTSIGRGAFNSYYGSKLTSVTFQGTISQSNFPKGGTYSSYDSPFPGDLRDKYLANGGGRGTYTTTTPVGNSSVWRKQ